jgi:hypothetical protein
VLENKIPIAALLENLETDIQKFPDVLDALYKNAKPLCERIQSILNQIENLSKADVEDQHSTVPIGVDPNTMQYSKEIATWAIAILSSAWALWVFTSKSQEASYYQTDSSENEGPDRIASRVNVKIILPYIRHSIIDTLDMATRIGLSDKTDYYPKPRVEPMNIQLRKE